MKYLKAFLVFVNIITFFFVHGSQPVKQESSSLLSALYPISATPSPVVVTGVFRSSLTQGSSTGFSFKKAEGQVSLSIDPGNSVCPPQSFTCQATVEAKYYSFSTESVKTELLHLEVKYDAKEGVSYQDKDIRILEAQANYIELRLTGVQISNTSWLSFVRLRGMLTEDVHASIFNFDIPPDLNVSFSPDGTGINVQIASSTQRDEEYDLEWTHVDLYDSKNCYVDGSGKTHGLFNYNNNATRVRVVGTTYTLANVFEAGFIMFRVRKVGYYKDNNELERRVVGKWSGYYNNQSDNEGDAYYNSKSSYILVSDLPVSIGISGVLVYQSPHLQSMNWEYHIAYSENAVIGEGITYFDGTLRNRQTVNKNFEDETSVVSETKYDYEGRGVINTLPVPVKDGVLKFTPKFNRNMNGEAYSAKDLYPTGSSLCVPATGPMSNTSGSSKYYSSNNEFNSENASTGTFPNSEDYVPVANGFPFVQVEYTADNSGKIRTRSSPGPEYQIGGVNTHETKFAYDVPEQQELDRLFGTEVGYSHHYKRHTTTDANGKSSVAYFNLSGKVVATALIDDDSSGATYEVVSNMLVKEEPQTTEETTVDEDGDLSIAKVFTVTNAGIHKFLYEVEPQKYLPDNCPRTEQSGGNPNEESPQLCYECVYDLEISITDLCRNEQMPGEGYSSPTTVLKRIIGGNGNQEMGTCIELPASPYSFANDPKLAAYIQTDESDGKNYLYLNLPKGTYKLVKSLKVNDKMAEEYLQHFLKTQKCKTLADFETEEWLATDQSGCGITCDYCNTELAKPMYYSQESFVSYKEQQFLLAPGTTSDDITEETRNGWIGAYLDFKQMCDNVCDKQTSCDIYREILISDVSPGGKYAKFDMLSNGDIAYRPQGENQSRFNILNPVNSNNDNPISYKTVLSGYDVMLDGVSTNIALLSPTQFVELWGENKNAWIPKLIKAHPEYCELTWCEQMEEAMNFTSELQKISTYAEAESKGFLRMPPYEYGFANGQLKVIVPMVQPIPEYYTQTVIDPLFGNAVFINAGIGMSFWINLWQYQQIPAYVHWGVEHPAESMSLWDMPVYETFCDDLPDNYNHQISGCIASHRDEMYNCVPYRDYYWTSIRNMYLSEREKLILDLKRNHNSCNPVLPAGYEPGFVSIAATDAAMNTTRADGELAMRANCEERCEAYKPAWRESLQGCYAVMGLANMNQVPPVQYTIAPEVRFNSIINGLYNVCIKGCDGSYPLGSSTVSPDSLVTGYQSFEDVLKSTYVNDGEQVHPVPSIYMPGICDETLIKMPMPYGHDFFVTSSPLANKCAADFPAPCSNAEAAKDVNDIIKLQMNVSQYEKCSTCIDCFEFASYFKMFLNKYTVFDEHNTLEQDLLTVFINQKAGLNLRFSDYKKHVISCLGYGHNLTSVFAKFKELHIDGITVKSVENPPASFAGENYTDCNGFLGTINSYMAQNWNTYPLPMAFHDYNNSLIQSNIYNWLDYYGQGNIFGELQTHLSGAGFYFSSLESLKAQLKICLPMDCEEFATRWYEYTSASLSVFYGGRRELFKEPYYSSTYDLEVNNFLMGLNGENSSASIWTDHLNLDGINYPVLSPPYQLTNGLRQKIHEYIDACEISSCSYNNGPIPWNPDGPDANKFPVSDPTAINTRRAYPETLILSVLTKHKPGTGNLIWSAESSTNILTDVPELFELIDYNYTYKNTLVYVPTKISDSDGELEGKLTAFQAPDIWFKLKTILIYSNRSKVNPNIFNTSISAYAPVKPASDFSFNRIYALEYVANTSYHFTEAQFIYKMTYQSPDGALKTQYVLLTMSDLPFRKRIISECYPNVQLCDKNPFEVKINESPCIMTLRARSKANARMKWDIYIAGVIEKFKQEYNAKCLTAGKTENFVRKFLNTETHHTLYYYDQAGNLVKTVSPGNVVMVPEEDVAQVNEARKAKVQYSEGDNHTAVTRYLYNTLNSLVWQTTPDAGLSTFYYDDAGRLVLSQNSKQKGRLSTLGEYVYSYTLYDNQSRISEVGELISVSEFANLAESGISNHFLSDWLNNNPSQGYTAQVTATVYDEIPEDENDLLPIAVTNGRNRVVKVYTSNGHGGMPIQNVYYSYDAVGNVVGLVRGQTALLTSYMDQEYKTMRYEFDVVTGSVKTVVYQEGEPDQYIHSYQYDKMNRLYEVSTGYRSQVLEPDAKYAYYKYGTLSRMVLGSQSVQGLDYAYTLQGWIKGVNSGGLKAGYDIGKDGYIPEDAGVVNNNQFNPKDEYGYILQYNSTDYSPGGTNNSFAPDIVSSSLANSSQDLFNGNIAMMTTAIQKFMPDNRPLATAYRYDELNRLKTASYFKNYDISNNKWMAAGAALPDYYNEFSYDADGNILTQKRNGYVAKGVDMDDIEYAYTPGTNQLTYVNDTKTNSGYDDDIKGFHSYSYDLIGNLETDWAEEIEKIEWTVYGKIKRITRMAGSQKPDLEFEYSPDGYRAVKMVIPKDPKALRSYTYYVRDVQGNVLATYTRKYTKTVDFEALTYQSVNNKIIEVIGGGGFAAFISGLHYSESNPDALFNQLHQQVLGMNVSDKETFLTEHFSFYDMLYGGLSIFRHYFANANTAIQADAIKMSMENGYCDPATLIKGTYNQLYDCANQFYYIDQAAFYKIVTLTPDIFESYLRYMYESDFYFYVNLTSQTGLNYWYDIESTIVAMRDQYANDPDLKDYYAQVLFNLLQYSYGMTGQDHMINIVYNTYYDETARTRFSRFASEYYKAYLLSTQGIWDVVNCFNYSSMAFTSQIISDIDNTTGWNTLLNMDMNAYVDVEDVDMPVNQDADWFLSSIKMNNPYNYLYTLSSSSNIVSNIGAIQQAANRYSSSGNGIEQYLQRFKENNSQQAFDAVVNYFIDNCNTYIDEFYLSEHHIYGSSRVGVRKVNTRIAYGIFNASNVESGVPDIDNSALSRPGYDIPNIASDLSFSFTRGEKNYELSNHLGNVMVVVSDKKVPVCGGVTVIYDEPFNGGSAGGWINSSRSSLVSNGTEQLNVNGQPGISQVLSPYIAFTPGKQYKLSFDLLNITAGNYLIVYTMYPYNYFVTWIGDNGHYEIMFTASAPSMQLYMNFQNNNSTAPVTFSLDNIRFEQIPGVNLKGYTADVIQANDYSPFGAPLPGRQFNNGSYRFGFNGKERDDEAKGAGNEYDYGFRIYNPRLGRFLSVDPLTRNFAFYSPYQYAGNKPIYAIDLDGLEDYAYIYKLTDQGRTLIQTIDYTKTDAGTGPLGHGVYGQVINQKGDKFSEAFISTDGNSIGSFSNPNVNRKGFENTNTRLNGLLLEKTVENALVDLGFDKTGVQNDVEVLNTDRPGWNGAFATFKSGTSDKYTANWETKEFSLTQQAHQSNIAKESGELGNTGLALKFYDGAMNPTDNVPGHIGMVKTSPVGHTLEATKAALSGLNIGAENAKDYNEQKSK